MHFLPLSATKVTRRYIYTVTLLCARALRVKWTVFHPDCIWFSLASVVFCQSSGRTPLCVCTRSSWESALMVWQMILSYPFCWDDPIGSLRNVGVSQKYRVPSFTSTVCSPRYRITPQFIWAILYVSKTASWSFWRCCQRHLFIFITDEMQKTYKWAFWRDSSGICGIRSFSLSVGLSTIQPRASRCVPSGVFRLQISDRYSIFLLTLWALSKAFVFKY